MKECGNALTVYVKGLSAILKEKALLEPDKEMKAAIGGSMKYYAHTNLLFPKRIIW